MKKVLMRVFFLVPFLAACSALICGAQARGGSSQPGNVRVVYLDGCRTSAQFSPDGALLLSDDNDGAELYASSGKLVRTLRETDGEPGDYVTAAAFSPDGTRVAVGTGGGRIVIWTPSGQRDGEFTSFGASEVTCLAFSPDGRYIAVGSPDNKIFFLDGYDAEPRSFAADPYLRPGDLGYRLSSYVNSVCFSPDGQLLAISAGETVRLWDISGAVPTYASDLMGEGTKAAFSPDGRLLATGGGNTFTAPSPVSLLTLDGSLVATLEVDKTLDAMAFRPDGRYLAVAARDGTVLIWDLNGMLVREIPKPGNPFDGEVAAIDWSTDLVTIAIAEGYCR